ncbi:MAG: DUF4112 domain-containing protein [Polyangiales bacterium]
MERGESSVTALRKWAERLVTLLDDRFRIPGTDVRFGLDPIIGIIFPGIGDAVTGTGSIGLLTLAVRRGVPRVVLWRMVLNILIDLLFGSLPIIGDIFDVAFKANRRNLELINEHESPQSKATAWDYLVVAIGVSVAIVSILVPLVAVFYFGFNYGPEVLEYLRLR